MTAPWIKWYPTDWRADPRLRMCSLAARGLWIDLLGYMHEGEPYGYLTINDLPPSIEDVAALVGRPLGEVRRAMAELKARQVFSSDALQGTLYSRRMVRDNEKADRDRRNGKGGGNPKLKGEVKEGVNPLDKAQKPEARDQKPEEEPSLRSGRARATRLPDTWVPSESDLAFAIAKGLAMQRIEIEALKFLNYWTSKSGQSATKIDWSKTWQNWILTATQGVPTNGKRTVHDAARDLAARVQALDEPAPELCDETGRGFVRMLPAR
jgi:hypothetical protein